MFDDDATATIALDPPPMQDTPRTGRTPDCSLTILGVNVTDVTRPRALELIEELILGYDGRTRSVFFVNAHTLNLAADDGQYRAALNAADYVFGDGTGVRWASRLQGRAVQDNLNGTDLVPALLHETAGRGYRYFLLGADQQTIRRAAQFTDKTFPGWTRTGCHHGYLSDPELNASVIRQINQSEPDVLLVGMGNPLQERWIHEHRHELTVPLCIGVGGLFSYWAGDLRRAPRWLRRCGWEWLGILLQQPRKARRYLLGNPLFVARILRQQWQIRRRRRGNVYSGSLPNARVLAEDHGLSR